MKGSAADLTAYEAAESAWAASEPKPALWVRGPWSVERRGDELADIAFHGTPVLRMIRAVVRDRDWNTLPVAVETVEDAHDGLRLGLRFEGFGGRFQGALTLRAEGDVLEVVLKLEALEDFERNRIGLVVLHPPAVAGAELTVTAPDGTVTRTAFPERIAPHQPAFDIAALRWTSGGVETELQFAGEVFEMEDQRNWTDASFKTYSTPLALPFPVLVRKGEPIEQTITLHATPVSQPLAVPAAGRVLFRESGRTIPEIAAGASTAAGRTPDTARTSPGSPVLVELVAATRNWRAALGRAADEAAGRPLDVRIVAGSADEVDAVLDALSVSAARLSRLAVFSPESSITEPQLWTALRDGVARRGLDADVLGGARSHFTELNRRHLDLPADLPALAFSVTPQMHATERAQLVESIAMQRLVAENAVRIAAGRPVHVGPVTLRARYNAVATSSAGPTSGADSVVSGYGAEFVPNATDPRQRSRATAAWTVASAAALSAPGVASITYFETWGPRGVLDYDGRPFPVAEALAQLVALAGAPALEPSGLPADVWAIAARTASGNVALLVNLRSTPVTLDVEGAGQVSLEPLSYTRLELSV